MVPRVSVVIPCYNVKRHILGVIAAIGPEVDRIYVVDDCCPQQTGAYVESACPNGRVQILRHGENRGVGAAVVTGYTQATADGADIIVKLDGDGQMDPSLIGIMIQPIRDGTADYTKGNRFYNIEDVLMMPAARLIGNAALSFVTKISTGYWSIFDPTNGFTAIHASVVQRLPLRKLSNRYFFESDMLFRLGTLRARVMDVPMTAIYGNEESGLKILKVAPQFLVGHLRNFLKRIFYCYFLRDFSIATMQFCLGMLMLVFGVVVGCRGWLSSIETGHYASTGTVMLAALPILLGVQLLLAFTSYDMASTPTQAIHPLLPKAPPQSPRPDDRTRAAFRAG